MLETNESIFLIGDFNTFLLEMDRFNRHISKGTGKLYSTINQLHIIDICRLFHPTITQNTFFLSSHGTRQTTLWTIKHTLTNAGDQKSCRICSQTTTDLNQKSIQKDSWKIPKYLKAKVTIFPFTIHQYFVGRIFETMLISLVSFSVF